MQKKSLTILMKLIRKRCDGDCLFRDRILAIAPRTAHVPRLMAALTCVALTCTGCAGFLPTVGPSRAAIESTKSPVDAASIQIFDIDDAVTRQLLAQRASHLLSETLGSERIGPRTIGAGDVLEVSIWEAAPATLFGTTELSTVSGLSGMNGGANTIATSHATTLPDQAVDDDGFIFVPFAGRIPASGKTLQAIQADIVARLAKKANQPEVMVRLTRSFSSNATVVGEVNLSTRVPLVPGNEKLLDALAAAGGVRQPVNKTTIQVTRARNVYSLPLETIIRDPQQNVPLLPGDVVTALFQPYSFIALGATGKTEEINFETQGITLAQALARSGGLLDSRSNARGVFIFRFEPQSALTWPRQPVKATLEGMVPTVFRIDLSDPRSFFLIQSFPIEDRDVLYVSNAPINEIEKFLNVLFTVAYPVLTAKQVGAF
jgi:polysaccharide export outer membrane protein